MRPLQRKETYSSLSAYLNCQMKYYWQEVVQIEPDVPIYRPLFFGKAVHDCLECWHSTRNIDAVMHQVAKHYKGDVSAERVLAEVMLSSYATHYPKEDFIIIESERTFELRFRDPDAPRKKWFLLGGRRDMVIDTGNDLFLMEHKTASQVDANYIDKLQLDHQITLYGSTYPRTLSGCLYNVLIKPRIKPGDNLDVYRERLTEIYANKNMFQRVNVWWSDQDFYQCKKHTYRLFKAIEQSRKTEQFIRNTSMCFYYQRMCAYHPLCSNIENAQFIIDSDYRVRPEHNELKEEGHDTAN